MKMKKECIKIWADYKIANDIKELLDKKSLVLDEGGLSRNISRTLQPLRDVEKLMVGYDQRFKKSVLVINGVGGFRKRKHVGASIFDIYFE